MTDVKDVDMLVDVALEGLEKDNWLEDLEAKAGEKPPAEPSAAAVEAETRRWQEIRRCLRPAPRCHATNSDVRLPSLYLVDDDLSKEEFDLLDDAANEIRRCRYGEPITDFSMLKHVFGANDDSRRHEKLSFMRIRDKIFSLLIERTDTNYCRAVRLERKFVCPNEPSPTGHEYRRVHLSHQEICDLVGRVRHKQVFAVPLHRWNNDDGLSDPRDTRRRNTRRRGGEPQCASDMQIDRFWTVNSLTSHIQRLLFGPAAGASPYLSTTTHELIFGIDNDRFNDDYGY